MSESQLNSVHLEAPRREEFRRAREAMLHRCGQQTLGGNLADFFPPLTDSKTAIQKSLVHPPLPDGDFLLLDGDSVYPLRMGVNTIGRLRDNSVVLEDPFVSRRHCAVVVHANQNCELHDVASKNGTFLNGRKLAGPTALASGDQIRMCDRQLIFMNKRDFHPQDRSPTWAP